MSAAFIGTFKGDSKHSLQCIQIADLHLQFKSLQFFPVLCDFFFLLLCLIQISVSQIKEFLITKVKSYIIRNTKNISVGKKLILLMPHE